MPNLVRRRLVTALAVAIAVVGVAALVVAGLRRDGGQAVQTATTSAPSTPAGLQDPNAGWFIPAPPGTQMADNQVLSDPDTLPLYIAGEQAEAYVRSGFRRVRLRSYYAGASGGGAFKVIDVADPRSLLEDLDRVEGGLGDPYPAVPRGRIRAFVTEMEDTAAHQVSAHSYIITFLADPYVVQIDAYATNAARARRRAETYARDQYNVLRARAR